MDPTRWSRIAALFHEVAEMDPDGRRRRLEAATEDDPTIKVEVEAMLAAEQSGGLEIEDRLLSPRAPMEGLEPLAEGTVLGSYTLGPLVGEGGMGEVYRAERQDGEFRQTVAVKLLRPGFLTAEAVRRFRRERQVLARLVHPDIVPILDGGTAPDGRPFFVLQFVEGVAITDYCNDRGLELEDRLRLFRRVAEAVHYAHGQLVVHRDLKPSNILVQPDGSPRLLDFGIAKMLEGDGEESAAPTRTGLRLLTPEHAAPEQLRGEPVATATDVYGLGVLLFELLTGHRPFSSSGRTAEELSGAILVEPAPLPSTVATGKVPRHRLRGDLDRIVAMALRKEPERRYRSAAELAEDVERYLEGRPVRAQRDTATYRVRKFVSRNRGGVAAGTLLILTLAGFAGTSWAQARRIAQERDRAEEERAAAEEVLLVLTSLLQRSNPRLVPGGDTVRVGALVDEAEARLEALADQPGRQLALWRTVGQLRTARGEHGAARDLLARAWEAHGERESLPLEDRLGLYHEWAVAVLTADGREAARPMLQRSLEQHRALLGSDDAALAVVLSDRAAAQPDARERARLLAEARAVRERLGGPTDVPLAAQLNAEGMSLYREGRMDEALPRFEESLEILSHLLPPEHPNRIAVGANVASSLTALFRWDEGEAVLREMEPHTAVASPPGQRANVLELLGLNLAHQGRLDRAEDYLRRSLDLARDSAAQRLPNTLRNLGAVLDLTGRPEEALPLLDSALTLHRARGDSDPGDGAIIRAQRAVMLAALGRTSEGLAESLAAADQVASSLAPDNFRRGRVEFQAGIVALRAGELEIAEARFTAALSVAEAGHTLGDPDLPAARCGLAVARARRGTADRARTEIEEDCRAYSDWGLAHPYLVGAAREASGEY